jgi:hypothetical protein
MSAVIAREAKQSRPDRAEPIEIASSLSLIAMTASGLGAPHAR